jgi:hypothetical protein
MAARAKARAGDELGGREEPGEPADKLSDHLKGKGKDKLSDHAGPAKKLSEWIAGHKLEAGAGGAVIVGALAWWKSRHPSAAKTGATGTAAKKAAATTAAGGTYDYIGRRGPRGAPGAPGAAGARGVRGAAGKAGDGASGGGGTHPTSGKGSDRCPPGYHHRLWPSHKQCVPNTALALRRFTRLSPSELKWAERHHIPLVVRTKRNTLERYRPGMRGVAGDPIYALTDLLGGYKASLHKAKRPRTRTAAVGDVLAGIAPRSAGGRSEPV